METQEQLQQPVELSEARFFDKLEDQYEYLWFNVLREAGNTKAILQKDQLWDLYNQPNIPQIFRDRSLLMLVSNKYMNEQGFTSWRPMGYEFPTLIPHYNHGYEIEAGWFTREEKFPDKKPHPVEVPKVDEWLEELWAIESERSSNQRYLSDRVYLSIFVNKFGLGELTEDELIERLNKIDIKPVSDTYQEKIENMPLIQDAIAHETYLMNWSLKMLDLCLEYHSGNQNVNIPNFLKEASETQIIRSYQIVLGKLLHKDNVLGNENSDWDLIKPAVDHFGWSSLVTTRHAASIADVGVRILEPNLQFRFVKELVPSDGFYVERFKGREQKGKYIQVRQSYPQETLDFIKRVALKNNDDDLLEIWAKESEFLAQQEEQQAKRNKELDEKRRKERENNPEIIAEAQRIERFNSLVKQLGELSLE